MRHALQEAIALVHIILAKYKVQTANSGYWLPLEREARGMNSERGLYLFILFLSFFNILISLEYS